MLRAKARVGEERVAGHRADGGSSRSTTGPGRLVSRELRQGRGELQQNMQRLLNEAFHNFEVKR